MITRSGCGSRASPIFRVKLVRLLPGMARFDLRRGSFDGNACLALCSRRQHAPKAKHSALENHLREIASPTFPVPCNLAVPVDLFFIGDEHAAQVFALENTECEKSDLNGIFLRPRIAVLSTFSALFRSRGARLPVRQKTPACRLPTVSRHPSPPQRRGLRPGSGPRCAARLDHMRQGVLALMYLQEQPLRRRRHNASSRRKTRGLPQPSAQHLASLAMTIRFPEMCRLPESAPDTQPPIPPRHALDPPAHPPSTARRFFYDAEFFMARSAWRPQSIRRKPATASSNDVDFALFR